MELLHFSARKREELERCASSIVGDEEAQRIADGYARAYVDVKQADALALVAWITRDASTSRRLLRWRFPATGYWHKQFEREIADVPPLR